LLQSEKTTKRSRHISALAKELLEYLAQPALQIRTVQLQSKSTVVGIKFPFHHAYLKGDYGRKNATKGANKKEIMSVVPWFDPKSVGVLT
jgi:hypothetical protein